MPNRVFVSIMVFGVLLLAEDGQQLNCAIQYLIRCLFHPFPARMLLVVVVYLDRLDDFYAGVPQLHHVCITCGSSMHCKS